MREVAELLKRRAFIFTCSYKTAWEQWMPEDVIKAFKFEDVIKHIESK